MAAYGQALQDILDPHHWTQNQGDTHNLLYHIISLHHHTSDRLSVSIMAGLIWSLVMLPQLSMTLHAMQRMEQTHSNKSAWQKSEIADFERALHVSQENDRAILRELMNVPQLGEHRFFDLMTEKEHDAMVCLPCHLIFICLSFIASL